MFARLTKRLIFQHRTKEQATFLDTLPKMKFASDEELINNVRSIYDKRQYLEECEAFEDVTGRIEAYLLRNPKCTVAHLQCFYKLKEMRMVSIPFRHNLHRKYHSFLLATHPTPLRNEHLQKYLWFLFDEGFYEREMFRQAAEMHTLALFQVFQYMNSLQDMPTWEPYIRISSMLRYLGHPVTAHKALGSQRIIDRVAHKYYPFLSHLFSLEEMQGFEKQHKYDIPFLTHLTDEYILKNVSQYDSYLQRVQFVQLQQQYERLLDIMVWPEFPAFLDLAITNYTINGGNDEIESRVSEIFFRLCEHADIDLQTITSILTQFLNHRDFMASRRFPIITRCTDSIFKRGLQDFSYLPAEAYLALLRVAQKLEIDSASRDYLQRLICQKVPNKLVWNQGQVSRLREFVEENEIAGGVELVVYLQELQSKQ